jgi:DNA repair exonuclease SbcCD ATPase subunit
MEALEIALAGNSSRIQKRRGKSIEEVVARHKGSPVKIEIINPNIDVLKYDSSRSTPFQPKQVIKYLYQIETTGHRARGLLPNLLQVHNILYPENIIKFLEADEKDKLRQVLNELVAGREIIEQWSRIESAISIVSRFSKDLKKEEQIIETKEEEIQRKINDLQELDIDILKTKWRQVLECFPQFHVTIHKLVNFEKSFNKPEDINNLIVQMGQLKRVVDEIKTMITYIDSDISDSLKGINQKLHILKEKIFEAQKELTNKERTINENQKKCLKLEEAIAETGLEIENNYNQHKKLNDLEKEIMISIDWLSEFLAEQETRKIEKETVFIREEIFKLKSALKKIVSLPKVKEIETAIERQASYMNSLSISEKEIERLNKILPNIEKNQQKVEKRLLVHRSKEENIKKILIEVHSKIEEFLELNSISNCPTCGKTFASPLELCAAIEKTKKTLPINEFPKLEEYIKQKLQYQRKIEETIRIINEKQKNIEEFKLQIEKHSVLLESYKNKIAEVEVAIASAGFDIPQNDNSTICERLKELLRIPLREELDKKEKEIKGFITNIDELWKNLRRNEYRNQRCEIEKSIGNVNILCNSLGFQLPEVNVNCYLSLLKGVKETKSQVLEDNIQLGKSIESSKLSFIQLEQVVKEKKQELAQIERLLRKKNNLLEEMLRIKVKYQQLVQSGLLKEDDVIEPDTISNSLNNFLSSLNAYKLKIERVIENNKLKDYLEKDLCGYNYKKLENVKNYEKVVSWEKKLRHLQSPQEYTARILKRNEDTINMFFNNLHWPRDFKEVKLGLDDELEITVEKLFNSKREPAHHLLSAGQRTALAVSLFWTLNASFRNVPRFLIMDEPIQNVDELNILNFLDGLRWYIESTGHQVFLTTANERIRAIVKKKFAYLKENYLELNLNREYGCTVINYIGWDDKEIHDKQYETHGEL